MSNVVVQAPRVRNSQPVKAELVVRYTDDAPGLLPVLVILSNYSPGKFKYRGRDVYHVEEIVNGMDGRAFLLHRTADAIDAGGLEADERYGVLISRNPGNDLCECRGHASRGYCKHVSALRGLIEAGHIDHPEAGRPEAAADLTTAPF